MKLEARQGADGAFVFKAKWPAPPHPFWIAVHRAYSYHVWILAMMVMVSIYG